MRKVINRLAKVVLTTLPIVLAFLIVAYLVANKPGPTQRQLEEETRALRVIEAPSVDLIAYSVESGHRFRWNPAT